MTAAAYEIARKKGENFQDQANADKRKDEGKEIDPRYKDWIP